MHRQCFENDFEMDLQLIALPLKRTGNVSKQIGSALQCIFNALKMHFNEKTL